MRGPIFKKVPRNILLVTKVLLIAVVGVIALRLTHASTPAASIQIENGNYSGTNGGQASRIGSSSASNSAAVKFSLAPVNPSNYITRWSTVAPFTNPIHFIDAYYNPSGQFDRIEVNATIEVASGGDGYYFSSFLFFPDTPSCTPNCYAYMGLQTVGARNLPPGGSVDKMAIFSVWNSTAAFPASGVTAVDFGGEGVGKSLRVAYDWQVGRPYKLIMYYNPTASNASTTYWTAYIVDVGTGANTFLGDVQMPSGLKYAQSGAMFHERYSGPVNGCGDMNPSQVTFSNISVGLPDAPGGRIAQSIDSWVIYQANVAGCNSSFWAKDVPGAAFRSGVNTPAQ